MGYPCICRSPGANPNCPAHSSGTSRQNGQHTHDPRLDEAREFVGTYVERLYGELNASHCTNKRDPEKDRKLAEIEAERQAALTKAENSRMAVQIGGTGIAALVTAIIFPPALIVVLPACVLSSVAQDKADINAINAEYDEKTKKCK